jgi:hypothetical protein
MMTSCFAASVALLAPGSTSHWRPSVSRLPLLRGSGQAPLLAAPGPSDRLRGSGATTPPCPSQGPGSTPQWHLCLTRSLKPVPPLGVARPAASRSESLLPLPQARGSAWREPVSHPSAPRGGVSPSPSPSTGRPYYRRRALVPGSQTIHVGSIQPGHAPMHGDTTTQKRIKRRRGTAGQAGGPQAPLLPNRRRRRAGSSSQLRIAPLLRRHQASQPFVTAHTLGRTLAEKERGGRRPPPPLPPPPPPRPIRMTLHQHAARCRRPRSL